MTTSWSSFLIAGAASDCVPEAESKYATISEIWGLVSKVAIENLHEGINTTIIVSGHDCSDGVRDFVERMYFATIPTAQMNLLEMSLQASVTCVEVLNDRMRDVLRREPQFVEKKIRNARAEDSLEMPFDASSVELIKRSQLAPDSSLVTTFAFRWTNGPVTRISQAQFVAIPFGKSNDAKVTSSALTQVVDALSKRKRVFVPYRLSAVTQLLSDSLESSKVFFVACLPPPEHYNVDVSTLVKVLTRCRDIISQLRSTEEFITDHELKNTILNLRKKLSVLKDAPPPILRDFSMDLAEGRLARQQKEKVSSLARMRLSEAQFSLADFRTRLQNAKQLEQNRNAAIESHATLEERIEELMDDIDDENAQGYTVSRSLEDAKLLEEEVDQRRLAQERKGEEAALDRRKTQARSLASTFRAAHQLGVERACAHANAALIERLQSNIASVKDTIQTLDEEISLAARRRNDMHQLAEQAQFNEQCMDRRFRDIVKDVFGISSDLFSDAAYIENLPVNAVADVSTFVETFRNEILIEEQKLADISALVNLLPAQSSLDSKQTICFDSNYSFDSICAQISSTKSHLEESQLLIESLHKDLSQSFVASTRMTSIESFSNLDESRRNRDVLLSEFTNLLRNFQELADYVRKRESAMR